MNYRKTLPVIAGFILVIALTTIGLAATDSVTPSASVTINEAISITTAPDLTFAAVDPTFGAASTVSANYSMTVKCNKGSGFSVSVQAASAALEQNPIVAGENIPIANLKYTSVTTDDSGAPDEALGAEASVSNTAAGTCWMHTKKATNGKTAIIPFTLTTVQDLQAGSYTVNLIFTAST